MQVAASAPQPSKLPTSAPAAKQQPAAAAVAKPSQSQRNSTKQASTGSEPKSPPPAKVSQPQTQAGQVQAAASKQPKAALAAGPVQSNPGQSKPRTQAKQHAQATAPASKSSVAATTQQTVASGPAVKHSKAVERQPSAVTPSQPPAAKSVQPAKAVPAAVVREQDGQPQSLVSLPEAASKGAPAKSPYDWVERTSETHNRASQAAAAAVAQMANASVADDWADKGVPVQSGYHMSDSPLPEEEELTAEAVHEAPRAPYETPSAQTAEAVKQRGVVPVGNGLAEPQAAKVVPVGQASSAKSSAQEPRPKSVLQTTSSVPSAAKPAAKPPATAVPSAKASLRSSANKGDAGHKQASNRPSTATDKAAAASSAAAEAAGVAAIAAADFGKGSVADIKVTQQAQPATKPSRLSVSSSAAQPNAAAAVAVPAPSDLVKSGSDRQTSESRARASSPSIVRKETGSTADAAGALSGSQIAESPPIKLAAMGKSSKTAAVSTTAQTGQNTSPSKGKPAHHRDTNGVAPTAATSLAVPGASPRQHAKADSKPPATGVKPAAPRQSSAALSGKPSASKAAEGGKDASTEAPAASHKAAPAGQNEPKPASVPSTTGRDASAKQTAPETVEPVKRSSVQPSLPDTTPPKRSSVQPPLPDATPPPSRPVSTHYASLAVPPIPGLASPEGPAARQPLLVTPLSPSADAAVPSIPGKLATSNPHPPPLPAITPPLPVQGFPSHPLPPEPSSPRPSPAVSPTKKSLTAGLQHKASVSSSDSGEDMDIDETAGKEALPPLPTEPFPAGLELAMIDSNQEVMDISAEDRDSLLDELSGINVSVRASCCST